MLKPPTSGEPVPQIHTPPIGPDQPAPATVPVEKPTQQTTAQKIIQFRKELEASPQNLEAQVKTLENIQQLREANRPSWWESFTRFFSSAFHQKTAILGLINNLNQYINAKLLIQHNKAQLLQSIAPYGSAQVKEMHRLIAEKNDAELRVLLDRFPTLVNDRSQSKTALQKAIETTVTPDIVKLLLEKGASVKIECPYKNSRTSPLLLSLQLNKPDIAQLLIEEGDDSLLPGHVNHPIRSLDTPLGFALSTGANSELITAMAQKANRSSPEWLPAIVQTASSKDAARLIDALHIDLTSNNPATTTLRDEILRNGSPEAVRYLQSKVGEFSLNDISKLAENDRLKDKTIINKFLEKSDKSEVFKNGGYWLIRHLISSKVPFNRAEADNIEHNRLFSNKEIEEITRLIK